MRLIRVFTLLAILAIGHHYLLAFTSLSGDLVNRPFANRQLLPLLGWGMEGITGLSYEIWIYIILMMFIAGMVQTLDYFYTSFFPKSIRTEFYILLTCFLTFFIGFLPPHTYDIPSMVLFTLSVAFIYREKQLAFFLLFPIVSLNKETAVILIFVWFVWKWQGLRSKILFLALVASYMVTRSVVYYLTMDIPGEDISIYLMSNLKFYAKNPYILLTVSLFIFSLVGMVSARWDRTPEFIRTSLIISLFLLIPAHLVAGISLEYRVYLEVLPLFTLISMSA